MILKQRLLEYLKTQPNTYNKSETRYMYRKDPELWNMIVEYTSFLPSDAKPKQRVWHVINESILRPVCPVTKEFVKWHENRYLGHISVSAASSCEIVTKKKLKSYKDRTGHRHWNSKDNTDGYEKLKTTHINNWGTWSSNTVECYNKFILTKINNGHCRSDNEKLQIEIYNELVEKFTDDSWYYSYSRINPDGLIRGKEYHLDHIYSRKEGFNNDVPPEIIGHWTNLRLIPSKENNGKSSRCDKTIEQLYEDYMDNRKNTRSFYTDV